MSSITVDAIDRTELEQVLQKTFASDSPLSANQILKKLIGPFRRPKNELEETLEAMAERGQIYRIRKLRGSQLYWDRKAEDYARTVMLDKLSDRARTRSELLNAVKNTLEMLPKSRREEILRELIRGGAVKVLPPFVGSRTERLSTRPADPRDYIEDTFQKVREKLAKSGISEEEVRAAALDFLGNGQSPTPREHDAPTPEPVRELEAPSVPVADVKDLVLARVMEIEVGALVPFIEFRQGLDFQDRREVDQAIWDLVRNELVAVHKHHHPISMSEREREASLSDDQGNLYHAISRRYR